MFTASQMLGRLADLEAKVEEIIHAPSKTKAEIITSPWKFPGGLSTTKLITTETPSGIAKIDEDGVVRTSPSLLSFKAYNPLYASPVLSSLPEIVKFGSYSPNSELYQGVIGSQGLEGVRFLEAGTYLVSTIVGIEITSGTSEAISQVLVWLVSGTTYGYVPNFSLIGSHIYSATTHGRLSLSGSFIYTFKANDIIYINAAGSGTSDLQTMVGQSALNIVRLT